MDFEKQILKLLEKSKTLASADLKKEISLEKPPSADLGDFALPCFKFSRLLRKAPHDIAKQIAGELKPSGSVKEIRATGPYVNFFLDSEQATTKILTEAVKKTYGSSNIGKGKKVIVEYSSPNIAKPFHAGHLRATIVGDSVYRCHDFLGYKCVRVNYLGDWGTQFGKLVVAFKRWGTKATVENDPINESLKLYIKFHEEAEKDSSLEDEARLWFKKMEDGDKEALKLWKWFRELSVSDLPKLYKKIGVEFDVYSGESEASEAAKKVMDELKRKGLSKTGEKGSLIIDLEQHGLGKAVLVKSDGSTLYITRDIATAEERARKHKFDKMIYAVSSEQDLHFRQLFKILELMGNKWANKCAHVAFGSVTLPEGKMSTRKGKAVLLEDMIERAEEAVAQIVKQKNPKLSEKEVNEIARKVGIGAIKFANLSHNRIKDFVFEWNKVLDFEGDTGPYVQYAYARTCRILEKAGKDKTKPSAPHMKEEKELIMKISEFPDVVRKATDSYQMHDIANYLLDLCHLFSSFYNNCPVLVADTKEQRALRLQITRAVNNVLKNGLNLLGIEVIERM